MLALLRSPVVPVLTTCLIALAAPSLVKAQGGLRYTVGVADFTNQSNWRGQIDLGQDLGIVLASLLDESGRFIVVGEADMRRLALEEQDLAASGRAATGDKAPATGHLTPAQLLVRGAITHVQHDTGADAGGIAYGGIEVGGRRQVSEINAVFYMVDATTGQVLASKSVVGISKKRGFRVRMQRNGTDTNLSSERSDNLQAALAEAAQQAVEWMVGRLGSLRGPGAR